MHLDAALNMVWLALGILGLACIVRARYIQIAHREAKDISRRAPAWLHIAGVALIVATLFPFISATDDLLRIEQLRAQHQHPFSSQKNANDDLIRLYQTMDTPLVATTRAVVFTLFFVLLVGTLVVARLGRNAPPAGGRSPPVRMPG